MTATHNHPPRCCCPTYQTRADLDRGPQPSCPACPEHGDRCRCARGPGQYGELVETTNCPIHGPHRECPSCHTHNGHPHTDYCREPLHVMSCDKCGADLDVRPHFVGCPLEEGTNRPHTPGYDGPEGTEWPHTTPSHAWGQDTHYPPHDTPHPTTHCHPECPQRPTPLTTGTPPICPACFHTAHPGSECTACYHRG